MAYTGRLNPNVVTFSGVGSHEGVEISRVEEYRRVENSVISFCETFSEELMAVKNSRQFPGFVINSYFKDNAFTLYNSQKQCKVLN